MSFHFKGSLPVDQCQCHIKSTLTQCCAKTKHKKGRWINFTGSLEFDYIHTYIHNINERLLLSQGLIILFVTLRLVKLHVKNLPVGCCHKNVCRQSVYIGLDVEREVSEERKTRSDATLSAIERRESGSHKETPTTRASPFIVHNTSLFTLHPKISPCLLKSIHCYRGTWQGFAKQKEKWFLQVGFQPLPPDLDRRGEGKRKEAGHIH